MLLTIAGVIAAIAVMNAVYPAVMRSSSALSSASNTVDERIRTGVAVVNAVGELNSAGSWVDTNSNSLFDFFVWTKNVGDVRIPAVEEMDVFFGQPGDITRIPHTDDAGASYPRWSYAVVNGSEWGVAITLRITISFDDGCPGSCSQPTGTYFVRVVTPNGVSAEKYFSM
jgi:flagellar protein FlaG